MLLLATGYVRVYSLFPSQLVSNTKSWELNPIPVPNSSLKLISNFKLQIRRRVKQVPLAFYKATPTSLFSESDFTGWSFKYNDGEGNFTENDDKIITCTCEEDDISAKRQRIESWWKSSVESKLFTTAIL